MQLRILGYLLAAVLALTLPMQAAFAQSAITITKAFNPSSVQVGGTSTTTMTVTITNPNSFTVTGIGFSDTYPAGLVPDVVGAYTCGPGSALFSGGGWAFSGVTLGPGASCQVPMLMHATLTGTIINTTSQVTGTGVPTSTPASASLNVGSTPVRLQSFDVN